jgi:hypothetical protein
VTGAAATRQGRAGHPPADGRADRAAQRRDALGWLAATGVGLALTALAVRSGAGLGTAGAPFLGRYRLQVGPANLIAPAVAAMVLAAVARGWTQRTRWGVLLAASYSASLSWTLGLALVDGAAGLTRALSSIEEYPVDLPDVGGDPLAFVRTFTVRAPGYSVATRGHPPAPVLLLWGLHRVGIGSDLAIGLLITAVGALSVPLVLAVVRDSCGEVAARRYLPLLVLAPYAVWTAVSMEAVVATLGAAALAAGVRASRRHRTGWTPTGWALAAGLLVGFASLFSYSAGWLGLSVVLLYFARRRAFLNLATGVGVLVPIAVAAAFGFSWVDGLAVAHADWQVRVQPHRPVLWWSGVSVVVLLLAAGPALSASLRKVRNTPGWPFLVGAGLAVCFSVLAGLARGGAEHAWLPYFPWLILAATAPHRPGGPPTGTPLLLTAIGATTAIIIEAVLTTAW